MQNVIRSQFVLPLPSFILHRYTAVFIAVIHVYLSISHLSKLFAGDLEWTHFWKGFGSLGGAYVFAALASRAFARRKGQLSGQATGDTPAFTLDRHLIPNANPNKRANLQKNLSGYSV